MFKAISLSFSIAFLQSCGADAPQPDLTPNQIGSSDQTARDYFFTSSVINQTELDCKEIRIEPRRDLEATLDIALSASEGRIYSEASCFEETSLVTLASDQPSVSFYFMSAQASDVTILASNYSDDGREQSASALVTISPSFEGTWVSDCIDAAGFYWDQIVLEFAGDKYTMSVHSHLDQCVDDPSFTTRVTGVTAIGARETSTTDLVQRKIDFSVNAYNATPYDMIAEAFLDAACVEAAFETDETTDLLGVDCSSFKSYTNDQKIFDIYHVGANAMYLGSLSDYDKEAEDSRPPVVDLSLHFNRK